jgi:MFS-type transporter involved in bile tolerance (Atg22 family)
MYNILYCVEKLSVSSPDGSKRQTLDSNLWNLLGIHVGLAISNAFDIFFTTVTPTGQETELMSLYLFCGQVLSWLLPLLFTILNEAGVSMSIGLASLNVFFAIRLVGLHNTWSYNVAREQARSRRDLEESNEDTDGTISNG